MPLSDITTKIQDNISAKASAAPDPTKILASDTAEILNDIVAAIAAIPTEAGGYTPLPGSGAWDAATESTKRSIALTADTVITISNLPVDFEALLYVSDNDNCALTINGTDITNRLHTTGSTLVGISHVGGNVLEFDSNKLGATSTGGGGGILTPVEVSRFYYAHDITTAEITTDTYGGNTVVTSVNNLNPARSAEKLISTDATVAPKLITDAFGAGKHAIEWKAGVESYSIGTPAPAAKPITISYLLKLKAAASPIGYFQGNNSSAGVGFKGQAPAVSGNGSTLLESTSAVPLDTALVYTVHFGESGQDSIIWINETEVARGSAGSALGDWILRSFETGYPAHVEVGAIRALREGLTEDDRTSLIQELMTYGNVPTA